MNESRKAGFSATVSALALMLRAAIRRSSAHQGTRPHENEVSNRSPSCSTTAYTGSVGATLYEAGSSGAMIRSTENSSA